MEDLTSAYYHHPPPPPHHQPHHYPSYYPPPPPPGAPGGGPPPPPPPQQPPSLPLPPRQYHHYHQPSFGSSYHSQSSPRDEVRTLFIAGLPDDVKPREIYNIFRDFPGYQSCQLRNSGQSSQAFAFAVFTDQQSAVTAMHALNGLIFDLEKELTLHIDLAKSNSRSKRQRPDDGLSYSDKKVRGASAHSRSLLDSGIGSKIHMSGMGSSAHSTNGYPSTPSQINFDYEAINGLDHNKNSSAPHVTPCPTLFVANLGPTCSEQELIQVFSRCQGFLKLKMQNKNGVPVAFVDFQDVTCSTGALNNLQGFYLYSSEGEGMRLEFAKSRMGLRRRERTS